MTLEIHSFWWILPTLVTVASFGYAAYCREPRQGDYSWDTGIIFYPFAAIPSLLAWLIWSLFA